MQRRQFLKAGVAVAATTLFTSKSLLSATADSRIEILLDEPIGTISPNIYGHFAEQLGGVIYDGIWVGEGSSIPNTNGIRTALTDALRRIHAPVIRWPGGCFADSYDWRDGISPRNQRPRRTNFWADAREARQHNTGVQSFEPNSFGTSDFVRFCRLSGAEPYIAANLRSLTALDFDRWVEYCNSPAGSTTLAEQRAKDGSRDPFNVRYWGIGNESWGCGGNFLPEDYAVEFRRFTTWVPSYGMQLAFVASGSSGDDVEWTHRFFEQLLGVRRYFPSSFWGWSVHHYAENLARGRTSDWIARKGDAVQFDDVDYYELLHEADRMEGVVLDHWNAMGEYDKQHRVKLVVDEYGPWYKPGSEVDPTHLLGQQITMRDAVVTALTLDTFNRHAEKVGMAACAQLINCLNSLFLAHENRFIVTPNYHVFEMYASHQSAQAVRAEFSAPLVKYERDGKPAQFWGLKGSASLNGKTAVLTVVNPHLSAARETEIAVRGAAITAGTSTVLANKDIHAHNTFEQPDVVKSANGSVAVGQDGSVRYTFPPASVTRLTFTLS
jgi:alpha-L-arabinofuranosidase